MYKKYINKFNTVIDFWQYAQWHRSVCSRNAIIIPNLGLWSRSEQGTLVQECTSYSNLDLRLFQSCSYNSMYSVFIAVTLKILFLCNTI
jgi:hypothetical protein